MARLALIVATVATMTAASAVSGAPALAAGDQDRQERAQARDDDGDLRDLLRDRVRTRQDLKDFIQDVMDERESRHAAFRDRAHERISDRRDALARDDDDDDDDDARERDRDRVRDRIADRRDRIADRRDREDDRRGQRDRKASREDDEGQCYFMTRSLRDEDGSFMVIVRRRVCRD